jgi:hypothetical protein
MDLRNTLEEFVQVRKNKSNEQIVKEEDPYFTQLHLDVISCLYGDDVTIVLG